MSSQSSRERDLTRVSLDALLAALDPNREQAALAYEALRHRLVTFFALRWPVTAEELADEALDRLARKLTEGESVPYILQYLLGIARMVALEQTRKDRVRSPYLHLEAKLGAPDPEFDNFQEAFHDCFDRLAPEERTLLEQYYAGTGISRINARSALARESGISLNALRNRVLRLRGALQRLTLKRLAEIRDSSVRKDNKK